MRVILNSKQKAEIHKLNQRHGAMDGVGQLISDSAEAIQAQGYLRRLNTAQTVTVNRFDTGTT